MLLIGFGIALNVIPPLPPSLYGVVSQTSGGRTERTLSRGVIERSRSGCFPARRKSGRVQIGDSLGARIGGASFSPEGFLLCVPVAMVVVVVTVVAGGGGGGRKVSFNDERRAGRTKP